MVGDRLLGDVDVSEDKVVAFALDAAVPYFERIRHHYSDYDMMDGHDKLDELIRLDELWAAMSLTLPETNMFTHEEKLEIIDALFDYIKRTSLPIFFMSAGRRLACQVLCNYLIKEDCFSNKYLRYLFVFDDFTDESKIMENFRFVLSELSKKIQVVYYLLGIFGDQNSSRVDIIKGLTQMFAETEHVSKKEKVKLFKCLVEQDIVSIRTYFDFLKLGKGASFPQLFMTLTSLRYVTKAYLSLSSVDLVDFFDTQHKGKHTQEKKRILFGLFDFVKEHYEQNTRRFNNILLKGIESNYTEVRKISYEILFAFSDMVDDIVETCMTDNAKKVRKVLGDVALSNVKYKHLDNERRKELVGLTKKYKNNMDLTNKQKKRLVKYEKEYLNEI